MIRVEKYIVTWDDYPAVLSYGAVVIKDKGRV